MHCTPTGAGRRGVDVPLGIGLEIRLTERTGAELIATRDFAGTRYGFDHGIHYNFVAANLDHQLTDRMTLVIPF